MADAAQELVPTRFVWPYGGRQARNAPVCGFSLCQWSPFWGSRSQFYNGRLLSLGARVRVLHKLANAYSHGARWERQRTSVCCGLQFAARVSRLLAPPTVQLDPEPRAWHLQGRLRARLGWGGKTLRML